MVVGSIGVCRAPIEIHLITADVFVEEMLGICLAVLVVSL